jgi:hypothetical protein
MTLPMLFAVIFFAMAVLLLLHHGWKHGQEDPEISHAQQESCWQVCYFQMSDVGNFKTCNHEMWIILFVVLGMFCLMWSD